MGDALERRGAAIIFLAILLAASAACKIVEGPVDSHTNSDSRMDEDSIETPEDIYEFEVNPDPDAAQHFAGMWAQLHVISHISNLPGYNAVETSSRMWQLVEVEVDAGGILLMKETMCDLQVETPTMPVDTIVPDAFISHLVPTYRHAVVDGSGPGSKLESDVMIDVRGCVLEDRANDPLCYSPEDERVIDQDEDGHPGMTLNFTGAVNAEVYVTQRWDSKFYNASAADSDHISGYVLSNSEQQIIDASNPVLDGTDPDPPELGSWPDPDPEHSYFEIVRLDDGATCEDVMALGLTPREFD